MLKDLHLISTGKERVTFQPSKFKMIYITYRDLKVNDCKMANLPLQQRVR